MREREREREREILALLVRVVLSTSSTIQPCQLCILFCPRIHTAISSKKNPYSYLTLFNFCFSIFFFFWVMEIKGIDPIVAAEVVFLPKHSNIILVRFSVS